MAKEYGRNKRVSAQMQKELAYVLQRASNDSRLGLVTVNEVVVSNNLAFAKIYVTVFNNNACSKAESVKVLNELTPNLRCQVAKRMRLKNIAEFRFYYDDSFDTGMRIAELLNHPTISAQP